MSAEHVTRANLALIQMRKLHAEVNATDDLERIVALRREMEVIHRSVLEIREEQLLEELEGQRRVDRPWWKLW